jgi:hypothetical protein
MGLGKSPISYRENLLYIKTKNMSNKSQGGHREGGGRALMIFLAVRAKGVFVKGDVRL